MSTQKSMPHAARMIAVVVAIMALIFLALPVAWLKVVGGDFSAPDIYIYGAWITGKDRSFWDINVAYKFQFSVVLFFMGFNIFIALQKAASAMSKLFSCISLLCLLLFPYWLHFYVDGVQGNSDSVILSINYQVGYYLYWFILVLAVIQVLILFKKKE